MIDLTVSLEGLAYATLYGAGLALLARLVRFAWIILR